MLTTLREANYTILPTKEGNPSLVKLDNTLLSEADLILFGANVETITFNLYTQLELFYINLLLYGKSSYTFCTFLS